MYVGSSGNPHVIRQPLSGELFAVARFLVSHAGREEFAEFFDDVNARADDVRIIQDGRVQRTESGRLYQ